MAGSSFVQPKPVLQDQRRPWEKNLAHSPNEPSELPRSRTLNRSEHAVERGGFDPKHGPC
jgi:hypothetical protein